MSKRRALRGGSFNFGTWILRAADRNRAVPENRFRYFGFRIIVKGRKP